jgi:hypothetical protein
MSSEKRGVDLARIWFIVSCLGVMFAYGVAVGRYQIFPFRILNYGVEALLEVRQEAAVLLRVTPTWHVRPARYDGDGVTVLHADQMAPGLTLLAGMFAGENQLRLIEPDGTPVRIWPARFTELFPRGRYPHIMYRPQTDWNAHIHGSLALPDGSVVFNFDYSGTVKFDRCGELEWLLAASGHHSVERSQQGGFWIPGRRWAEVVTGFPRSEEGYSEDLVLRVSDAGEVLEEVSIVDIFTNSGLRHLLLLTGPGDPVFRSGEIVHLNDIQELPDSIADQFPDFEGGDLILSLRNEHLLAVVDPRDWRVKWYQMGPWIRQHDPDFQPGGTITIFNNDSEDAGDGKHLGASEIQELVPSTGEIRVLYGGTPGQEMYTAILGKHQVLPNGNILITESEGGRILEVTEQGDVVWELINRHDDERVAIMTQATRYPPSYFEVEDWACEG